MSPVRERGASRDGCWKAGPSLAAQTGCISHPATFPPSVMDRLRPAAVNHFRMFLIFVSPSVQPSGTPAAMMTATAELPCLEDQMRKSVFVIALLAATVSVPAMAKDARISKSAVEGARMESKASMSGPARLSD